jgi:hypothetical protein
MIAITSAKTGGLAMPTMFVSASHRWMTRRVDLRDIAELVVQGLPVDEPGQPFELASQAQSTPNTMRTTAAPRSQLRPKMAERVVLGDESAAEGPSRVAHRGAPFD